MQARRTTMSAGPGASILAVDARRQAAAAWRLEMLARRVCEQQHELDLQVGVRASRPAVAGIRQGWSQATRSEERRVGKECVSTGWISGVAGAIKKKTKKE